VKMKENPRTIVYDFHLLKAFFPDISYEKL
jgi:hypothetical protein